MAYKGVIKEPKQGTVTGDIVFKEDSTQPSAGVFRGKVTTDFTLDKKGRLNYDALMMVADGYSKNQCTTIWTSYKTGKSQKCNWGDYRMPDSRELDSGAGDVHIEDAEWWK